MHSFDAHFVRHAESAGNAGLKTTDPASIPLTELGLQQAAGWAAAFPFEPAFLAVSPFLRARQTAEALQRRFPKVESEVLPIQEFTYLAPERWIGTTMACRKPAAEQYWDQANPEYCDGEGAETFAQFMGRAEAILWWLADRQPSATVLVCHEFFIRAVVWRCLSQSLEHAVEGMREFRAWYSMAKLPNTSTTRVILKSNGTLQVILPANVPLHTREVGQLTLRFPSPP